MALETSRWNNTGTGEPSEGPAWPTNPKTHAAEIANAIGQLTPVDFFGELGATGVKDVYGWRIDRQNAPKDFVNLSVQRNNVPSPSTVASVFIPTKLNIAPGPGGPTEQPFAAKIAELERAVRRGLEQSLASWVAGAPGKAQITRMVVSGYFSTDPKPKEGA